MPMKYLNICLLSIVSALCAAQSDIRQIVELSPGEILAAAEFIGIVKIASGFHVSSEGYNVSGNVARQFKGVSSGDISFSDNYPYTSANTLGKSYLVFLIQESGVYSSISSANSVIELIVLNTFDDMDLYLTEAQKLADANNAPPSSILVNEEDIYLVAACFNQNERDYCEYFANTAQIAFGASPGI